MTNVHSERDEEEIKKIIASDGLSLVNKIHFDDEALHTFLLQYLEHVYQDKPIIVTLTGAPGSGKSTLVNALLQKLNEKGHTSEVISTDGFGLYGRKERNERIANGTKPIDVKDFELNKEIIAAVRKGESVKAPVYNELTGDAVVAPKEDWRQLSPHLHFLFEEGDFQPLEDPDVRIYLHVPTDIRRTNRIERDLLKRGGYGGAEEIRKSFDYRLESQYYPYTLPHANKADILIVTEIQQTEAGDKKYSYKVYKRK